MLDDQTGHIPRETFGPSPAGARGTLALSLGLPIREFRALWTAQVLFAGDQVAQVAIAILVFRRSHSAFLAAFAYALTYLPPIADGPLLSGLADLFPRRRPFFEDEDDGLARDRFLRSLIGSAWDPSLRAVMLL